MCSRCFTENMHTIQGSDSTRKAKQNKPKRASVSTSTSNKFFYRSGDVPVLNPPSLGASRSVRVDPISFFISTSDSRIQAVYNCKYVMDPTKERISTPHRYLLPASISFLPTPSLVSSFHGARWLIPAMAAVRSAFSTNIRHRIRVPLLAPTAGGT